MIFTFYSFKGGVAQVLAERGLKVLAVDFDLEAPGLERYFFDGDEVRHRRTQRGLIDLVAAYREALTNEAAFQRAAFRDLAQFTQPVRDPVNAHGGKLDLVTAGRREPDEALRDYALMVRTFDWQDFFKNWKGDRFFDWLQRQWNAPETGYDVVLIDSRTGVTEMGGVCAYQLADVAVLLCAPNYQNLEGTRDVVRDFVSGGVMALRHGRELEILAVPAHLAADHPKREDFLRDFEKALGSEAMPAALALADAGLSYRSLALPYDAAFAISERLVGEAPADDGGPYARLADALTLLAKPGSRLHAQRGDALARLRRAAGLAAGEAAEPGAPRAEGVELLADTTQAHAGYDVFLDFDRQDAEPALALQHSLRGAGFIVFSDSDVEMRSSWHEVPDAALRYSQVMLLCIGRQGQRERQRRLMRARELERLRIVPVLLPGSEPEWLSGLALEDVQPIDLRSAEGDNGHAQVLASLTLMLRAGAPPVAAAAEASAASPAQPYPGPRPYTEDEQRWFAGRDAEIQALAQALAAHDVVWLQGPACSGKTSLLNAALLPRLRQGRVAGINAQAVAVLDLRDGVPASLPEPGFGFLALDHADAAEAEAGLDRLATWLQHLAAPDKVLLLCRDVWSAQNRARLQALQQRPASAVLALPPLQGAALREALESPARRAGVLFEPGLVERLVESAGAAHNRALQLQLALRALWAEQRRGWLTNRALDDAGHLAGLFKQHVQQSLAALPESQRDAACVLFRTLSVLDSNQRLGPTTLPWALVATVPALRSPSAAALRDAQVAAGLIDLWYCQTPEVFGEAGSTAEPAVALARGEPLHYLRSEGAAQIPDLRFLLWRGGLTDLQRAWSRSGRLDEFLLAGAALRDAEEWLTQRGPELMEPEAEYIGASRRAAQLRDAQSLAAQKRRNQMVSLVAVSGLMLATLATWGWIQARRESSAREVALRESVVINAASEGQATLLKLRPGSDVRALLQLVAARRMSSDPRVASLLAEGLMAQPGLRAMHELPQAQGGAAAFAPGAQQLVYAAEGKRWATLEPAAAGGPVPARVSAWSWAGSEADASLRATLMNNGTQLLLHNLKAGRADLLDLAGGGVLATWRGKSADGRVVSLGANWQSVATVEDDYVLRLHRHPDWRQPRFERAGIRAVLALDDNGKRLLVQKTPGRQLQLLDASTGALLAQEPESKVAPQSLSPQTAWPFPTTRGIGAAVRVGALSPDGKRLAVVTGQGLQIYDDQFKPQGVAIKAQVSDVLLMAFSADGQRLATYDADKQLQTFDLRSGRLLAKLTRGHDVTALAFSADGQSLWTAGSDGTARRWDVRLNLPAGRVIEGPAGRTWAMAWGRGGKTLYTGGEEGRLQRWDINTGKSTAELAVSADVKVQVNTIAVSGYEALDLLVAAGTFDGSVRRWVAGAEPMAAGEWPRAHKDAVNGLAFMANATLVSAGSDGQFAFWPFTKDRQEPATQHASAQQAVASMALHLPSDLLATGQDKEVRFWKAGMPPRPDGEAVVIESSLPRVDVLAFRPDGKQLAVGSDALSFIGLPERKARPSGFDEVKGVWALAYSPDSALLATGSSGGEIRLWRTATNEPATPLIRMPVGLRPLRREDVGMQMDIGATTVLAFSPDNQWLAVAGDAGLLWVMPHPERWADELCARAGRNLSDAEWKRWVSKALPYQEQCPGLPKPANCSPRQGAALLQARRTSSIVVTPTSIFSMPSGCSLCMPSARARRFSSSARAPVWIRRRRWRDSTDKLLAFGCPACDARLMSQMAAHLMELFISHVPVRQ